MRSYFFVPATKLNKISTILSLGVSEIIIDFEDSVLQVERENLLVEVKGLSDFKKFWYRVPLRNSYNELPDLNFLIKVLNFGINKIILPKLSSKNEYASIFEHIKAYADLRVILLIEHPRLLLEGVEILQDLNLSSHIMGLGIGSHDLMTFLDMEHTSEQLKFPRAQLLYLAKAFEKEAIDIASMNIGDKVKFEEELMFGVENGYDAKFLIHPKQISWLLSFGGLKENQIVWAQKIVEALPKGHSGKEIEPFILDGEIIEKPHVEKAKGILEKFRIIN